MHLSIYLSIYQSIYLSIHPSIHPSIYLYLYLCLYIYIYIYIHIHIYLCLPFKDLDSPMMFSPGLSAAGKALARGQKHHWYWNSQGVSENEVPFLLAPEVS